MHNILPTRCENLIRIFGLEPHPEGGWYRKIWQSEECLPLVGDNKRPLASSILYLLSSEQKSCWHQIDAEEQWHFYEGQDLLIHMFSTTGVYSCQKLCNHEDITVVQMTVPANTVFAVESLGQTGYSFVGCTVIPAFQWEGFRLFTKEEMIEKYPEHIDLIEKFYP